MSLQGRKDPLRELGTLRRRMESIFDELLPREEAEETAVARWRPAMDVAENDKRLVLEIELPGMSEKDVTVRVDDHSIVVEGEKKEQRQGEEGEYRWRESHYGSFYRRMSLPPGVDAEHIDARMRNGILRVSLPKLEQAQAKRIQVKAA